MEPNVIIGIGIIVLNIIGTFSKNAKYLPLTLAISLIMALLLSFGVI